MPQIFKHFFVCSFVFFNVYSSSFYISTRMITSKQSETAVKVCDFTSILEFPMICICSPSLLYSCFQNFTCVDEDPDMCLLGLGLYSMTGKP